MASPEWPDGLDLFPADVVAACSDSAPCLGPLLLEWLWHDAVEYVFPKRDSPAVPKVLEDKEAIIKCKSPSYQACSAQTGLADISGGFCPVVLRRTRDSSPDPLGILNIVLTLRVVSADSLVRGLLGLREEKKRGAHPASSMLSNREIELCSNSEGLGDDEGLGLSAMAEDCTATSVFIKGVSAGAHQHSHTPFKQIFRLVKGEVHFLPIEKLSPFQIRPPVWVIPQTVINIEVPRSFAARQGRALDVMHLNLTMKKIHHLLEQLQHLESHRACHQAYPLAYLQHSGRDLLLVLITDLALQLLILNSGLHVKCIGLQTILRRHLVTLYIIFSLVLLSFLHHTLNFLDFWNASGATNQDNIMDLSLVHLCITKGFLNWVQGATEEVSIELLKSGSEVNTLIEGVDLDAGLSTGGQGTLCPLTGSAETANSSFVVTDVFLVFALELCDEVVHHPVVKIFSSQVSVSCSRLDLKDAILN
ncbi:hypothetical protein DNTS_018355, partial [Danionella cerebrum]